MNIQLITAPQTTQVTFGAIPTHSFSAALRRSSRTITSVARPKEFVEEQALDAAIDVFREHGFDGTSAEMLVRALGIGRQSLYDTFGDKWQIYLSSVRRYVGAETRAHVLALRSGPQAIDGIGAMS